MYQPPTLLNAFKRFQSILFPVNTTFQPVAGVKGSLSQLEVIVRSNSEELQLGIDESYQLMISDEGGLLDANTVYGALHGLETLAQLIDYDIDRRAYLTTSVKIVDSPRYPWRGLLIDTSRHFLPMRFIKEHIVEALAMNKMNTLHVHFVDAQSWPLVIPQYPLLSGKASFGPKAVYTADDLADLVRYAQQRGVRVVPEIDVPGHSYAIGMGYPNLVAKCPARSGNINNVPVNPTLDATYDLLRAVVQHLARILPDRCFHTGGDEVVLGCWQDDSQIAAWALARGLDMKQLEAYFTARMRNIVEDEAGRTNVVWEELFLNREVELDPSTIVQAWRSTDALRDIVRAGYRGLLSAGWYLDKQIPVAGKTYYEWMDTWKAMYQVEPEEALGEFNSTRPARNGGYVLGGEATMWAEQIDEYSFDERVWPRAGAVAERLWSPKSVADITAALTRLNEHSCRMKRRGIHSGPIKPMTYCPLWNDLL